MFSARRKSVYTKIPFFVVILVDLFYYATTKINAMDTDTDIDTNRPSFTDSPLVVPKGSLQLENGLLYQHAQHGIDYYEMPETEVRLGLTKQVELQMFVPDWAILHASGAGSTGIANSKPTFTSVQTAAGTQSGASDLTEVGLKAQMPSVWKDLNAALIGGVTVPTGSTFISGRGIQPIVRMPWSKTIYGPWSISGMQSILVVNAGSDVQWQNFWVVNRNFGQRTTVFTEYAGFYTHAHSPSNIIHFGLVRKLDRHHQIDIHFGFGLDKTAPAAFIGTGYSFRFDHLPLLE